MSVSQLMKCACVLLIAFLMPMTASAQNAAGSAFGESVDLSINVVGSLITVQAQSGPIPMVSDSTSPAYSTSDTLVGVDVGANIGVSIPIIGAITAPVTILETGLLSVSTSGDTSPDAESSASVLDVDLQLLGASGLLDGLLPLVLGLTAEEVVSTASASGSCDAGLSASGTTSLVGAEVLGSVLDLINVDANLLANPPANYVLLDLALAGGNIRVVLNEQIVTGDGDTSVDITVNAVHVTVDGLPIAAIIAGVTGDIIISQSQASVTCSEADISVNISDSPEPVTSGDPLTYTIDVSNSGPDTAGNVMLEHVLPAGVIFVSANADEGTCNESSGIVSCNLGVLPNGADNTITVIVTPGAPGTINTSVSVSSEAFDPYLLNNTDSETTVVDAIAGLEADLTVDIGASPDPVTAGDMLTVTLDISNNGPDAASGTVVVYTPPAGVPINSVTPSQGTCTVTTTTITCNLGDLANDAIADIEIVMTPTTAGPTDHEAVVSSNVDDPTTGNNTDTAVAMVIAVQGAIADIGISKNADVATATVGELLTYTLAINNAGPDDTNSVVVTDSLPDGIVFESASPSQGSCTFAEPIVTCNLGAVANAAAATVTIVVTPKGAGQLLNSASVTSDIVDDNTNDNTDTETTTVVAAEADLSITKVSSVNPAIINVPFYYTITVNNAGPNAASDVLVTDDLPADLEFISALPDQGNCQESNGSVTCSLGTIANGAAAAVTIHVTPTAVGELINTAIVDSSADDPDEDDNTVVEDTDVVPGEADLSITKVSSVDPAMVGVPFFYTITVSNAGPDAAGDVEVTDSLPDGLSFGSAIPSQGSCQESNGTVTCELGAVADDDDATVVINVTPTAVGALTNTAAVDSSTNDPDEDDNTVDEETDVVPFDVFMIPAEPIPSMGYGGLAILIMTLFGFGLVSVRRSGF